jgi:hypothetical protein
MPRHQRPVQVVVVTSPYGNRVGVHGPYSPDVARRERARLVAYLERRWGPEHGWRVQADRLERGPIVMGAYQDG